MTEKFSVTISIRLTRREMELARNLAEANRESLSAAIRRAIVELGGGRKPVSITIGTVNSAVMGIAPAVNP